MTKENNEKLNEALKGLFDFLRSDIERPETHKHKCGECGYVWEHETDGCLNDEKAHTCSVCNTVLGGHWEWYEGADNGVFETCLKG